jgi:hypothetical protein
MPARTLLGSLVVLVSVIATTALSAPAMPGRSRAVGNQIVAQGERGRGDGTVMSRSHASGRLAVHLDSGQKRILPFEIDRRGSYAVSVRHSNDNDNALPSEQLKVSIDGAVVGAFLAADTGDGGLGWNVFRSSGVIGSRRLERGLHKATAGVAAGDGFGVEIDFVKLRRR